MLLMRLCLVICLVVPIATGCGAPGRQLRVATTTSVDNSGLLEAILPPLRSETGIDVQVLAVGSGRALQLLQRGDADVALTHDPIAEAAMLNVQPAAVYRKIMFNDFVVVGPPTDDARVKQATGVTDAIRRIATSTASFASRGDDSGTSAREQQLWQQAGTRPSADRILETGQGMSATLRVASERQAYTLTDRATYMQLAPVLKLQVLFEHDRNLLNTYAVSLLRGSRRERDAMHFVTWISDGNGRARIASFTIAGVAPFFVWPPARPRDTPTAFPQ